MLISTMDHTIRKVLRSATAVFLLSHLIFVAGISFPPKLYWDELHYIPAARKIFVRDQIVNREHPPLAKTLMAISIAAWGDNPFGWRYMSALFGSLALTGMYVWALQLFMNEEAALWAAAITLVNQFLYVQSRVATLDVFVLAFTLWALALFTATWHSRQVKRTFIAIGVMLGLAIASKWTGLIPLMMIIGIVTIVKILQNWRTVFEIPNATDWYRPDLWANMRVFDWIVSLALIPAAVYFLTFVPDLRRPSCRTPPSAKRDVGQPLACDYPTSLYEQLDQLGSDKTPHVIPLRPRLRKS